MATVTMWFPRMKVDARVSDGHYYERTPDHEDGAVEVEERHVRDLRGQGLTLTSPFAPQDVPQEAPLLATPVPAPDAEAPPQTTPASTQAAPPVQAPDEKAAAIDALTSVPAGAPTLTPSGTAETVEPVQVAPLTGSDPMAVPTPEQQAAPAPVTPMSGVGATGAPTPEG